MNYSIILCHNRYTRSQDVLRVFILYLINFRDVNKFPQLLYDKLLSPPPTFGQIRISNVVGMEDLCLSDFSNVVVDLLVNREYKKLSL